jgi:hypothetical protein
MDLIATVVAIAFFVKALIGWGDQFENLVLGMLWWGLSEIYGLRSELNYE